MDVWRRMIRAQGGDPDAALPVGQGDPPRRSAPADGVLVAARRARGRRGRVAPRCRASAQGGPGAGGRGRRDARQAGSSRPWGEPLLTLHTDEPGAVRPGSGGPRGRLHDRPGGVEAGPAADRHRTRLLTGSPRRSAARVVPGEGCREGRLGVRRGPRVMFSSSARQGGTDATAAVRDHRAKLAGPGADPQDRWTVGSSGRLVAGARLWRVRPGAAPRSRSEFDSQAGPAGNFEGLPRRHGSLSWCDGVCPILENSTACQIIDANYLVSGPGWLRSLWVWLVGFRGELSFG